MRKIIGDVVPDRSLFAAVVGIRKLAFAGHPFPSKLLPIPNLVQLRAGCAPFDLNRVPIMPYFTDYAVHSDEYAIESIDDAADWNEYVEAHSKGSIFHTREMVRAYHHTRGYEPIALLARNTSGNVVAMLVAVRIATLPGVLGWLASRSVFFAEPICDENQNGQDGLVLLIREHDRRVAGRTLFAEVRPLDENGAERTALEQCGFEYRDYLNYISYVERPTNELWKKIKGDCRRDIRRSEDRGVILQDENSPAGIDRLYEFLQVSYGLSQVPLPDRTLFDATLTELPHDWFRVVIAYLENRPMTSSIDLVYKGRVYGWYGGTERVRGISANACITWDSIRWAAENEQTIYDFGGAGWPDEPYAPRKFKSKFGGELVDYGRYRKVYSPWKLQLAERVYEAVRSVIWSRERTGRNS